MLGMGTPESTGGLLVYRLFISHSSRDTPAKERLRDLAEAIRNAAPGEIEVLYDLEQIEVADDWRKRIAFMLHMCDGAAVLLDDAAIESKWVLAEATFASLRHAYNENFTCVPISFLDEADLEVALKKKRQLVDILRESDWSVASLRDIQFAEGMTVVEIADAVVAALRAKGQLHTNNPVDRLADGVGALLKGAPSNSLDDLARRVENAARYLSSDRRCLAGFALVQQMLQSLRLRPIRDTCDDFGMSFSAEKVSSILDLLFPLRLPIEASEMLHRRRESGGYAHASICVAHPKFFIERYVQRAHLSRRPPPCLDIGNTYGTFEELQAQVRERWRAQHRSAIRQLTDEQVDDGLRRSRGVYVWVPGPVGDDVILRLDEAYPSVGFIVHYSHDDVPSAFPPNVLPIRPALTADEEIDIIEDYEDAMLSLSGGT